MTLRNRVDPYGRLHAVPERGTMMGNRGVLHDAARRVVAGWRTRRWIACALEFRGRKRDVFAPRRYSELFFLDEITALAAGHRPCAECRHARYVEFRAAWAAGRNRRRGDPLPGADEMDRVIHGERTFSAGGEPAFRAPLSSLPSGVMVEVGGDPHLYRDGRIVPWSFAGYGRGRRARRGERAVVITPRSIVEAIRAGYEPQIHESGSRRPEGPVR